MTPNSGAAATVGSALTGDLAETPRPSHHLASSEATFEGTPWVGTYRVFSILLGFRVTLSPKPRTPIDPKPETRNPKP